MDDGDAGAATTYAEDYMRDMLGAIALALAVPTSADRKIAVIQDIVSFAPEPEPEATRPLRLLVTSIQRVWP